MSCKDIIPQITIDGITVEEIKQAKKSVSFSNNADELFMLSVSHTNLIQIDSGEDSFSLGELLDATAGTPNLYNLKVLVTDTPEKYELIQDAIKLSEQVSSYLYSSPDSIDGSAASNASNKEIKAAADGGLGDDAPSDLKDTVGKLNACAFKVTKKKTEESGKTEEQKKTGGFGSFSMPSFSLPSFMFQKPETLRDRVIDALNDNTIHLDATKDGIASITIPIEVTQKEISLKGYPPVPNFTNSQELKMSFSAEQLKNLYFVFVPNVEYREDKELIFTVRDYKSIPLILNFQPQLFGGNAAVVGLPAVEQKKVVVTFIDDEPSLDLGVFLINMLNAQLENTYGEEALKTFKQNKKPEPFVSSPVVSLGYNEEINGCFFLNQKTLAKNLTAFEALLEQPELYKQILQGVIIKKVYDDGKEVELLPPTALQGLSFEKDMIRGYTFTDKYDIQNFKYVVEVTAKNPIEYLLQYVIPKLSLGKAALDSLVANVTIVNKSDLLVILNPVSGFFTDDYLASELYKSQSLSYNAARKLLFTLYNFLLVGDPIAYSPKPLVKTKQLYDLQKMYVDINKTLQLLAEVEQINIQNMSLFSFKKKATSNKNPYKTLSLQFEKPYIAPSTSVFVDFLYEKESPNRSGFEINPTDLLTRITNEGILLKSFGESNTNSYTDTEPLSITPISIKIDQTAVSLVADLPNVEEITTNVLLAAELEVKDPKNEFTNEGNILGKLLETDGAQLVNTENKTLKIISEKDNFVPTDITNNRPDIKAQKRKLLEKTRKVAFESRNKKAKEELGDQTAKALYLSEANESVFMLAYTAFQKLGIGDNEKIDPKHSFLDGVDLPSPTNGIAMLNAAAKNIEPLYKNSPSTFMTRFMNSYQLEYLSGFDKNFIPLYSPLTKDVISKTEEGTATVARLRMKAGVPIRKEYTILHSYFLISNTAISLNPATVFTFLPTISTSPIAIPPLTINIPLGPIGMVPTIPFSLDASPAFTPITPLLAPAMSSAGVDDALDSGGGDFGGGGFGGGGFGGGNY